MIGQRINHRAAQIDVEDREVEILALSGLHRVLEPTVGAAYDASAGLDQLFELECEQKLILHQEDCFSLQETRPVQVGPISLAGFGAARIHCIVSGWLSREGLKRSSGKVMMHSRPAGAKSS